MSNAQGAGVEVDGDFERLQGRMPALDPSRAASDPLLQSITAHSPDVIMLLDRQCTIRFINRTSPDLTVEQVIGQSVYLYVPPEQRKFAFEHYERVAASAQPTQFESIYIAATGDCSYWVSRVGPLLMDGRVTGFVVVARDVTEVRRRESERERFFNLSEDMLCVMGADSCYERVSPAFEATMGYGPRDLLGVRSIELVHPDDRQRSVLIGRRVREGESTLEFENRVRRRDGEYRFILWRATADADGSRVYAVGRDVTEHKRLQAQLQHAELLGSIGRLASGIAHDFGNLLLAIRLNLRGAREQARADSELFGQLGVIESATERAAGLTRQLLAFARQHPAGTQATAFDLNELCRDLNGLLRRVIPENIAIVLALTPEPCVVDADRSQVEQVLMNLCLNARDAMPGGGSLCIASSLLRADREFCAEQPRALPGQSYAVLRVEDTGVGMSPDVQARLFEPFFSTKPPGLGTGLGLATAQASVSRYGGLFRVRSRPGQGSSFELYLPHAGGEPCRSPLPPARSIDRGNETLLIAEDEELVRNSLTGLLEQAGYTVLAAHDGVEAVALYRRFQPTIRLLILDVTMPRLGGVQALLEIRKLAPDVHAILTSGYEGREPELDHASVLYKPYDPLLLLRRIRSELAV